MGRGFRHLTWNTTQRKATAAGADGLRTGDTEQSCTSARATCTRTTCTRAAGAQTTRTRTTTIRITRTRADSSYATSSCMTTFGGGMNGVRLRASSRFCPIAGSFKRVYVGYPQGRHVSGADEEKRHSRARDYEYTDLPILPNSTINPRRDLFKTINASFAHLDSIFVCFLRHDCASPLLPTCPGGQVLRGHT